MPTTKKENFYFGMMMCIGMVIGMTFYNLVINDLIGTISLQGMLLQLILGFIIAFILELFIVGPIAHKVAFSLPYDKSNKLFVILSLAFCMVIGMVLSMSIYGVTMAHFANSLGEGSLLKHYFLTVGKNFIFALPLQLLIIGPLVRFSFAKLVKGQKSIQTDGVS
ncbi:hypothetical protein [Priestia endophytica]|uniref:hypothetical protein n=1 Tax=Priestia endophytica TaxID=135735 RepID=UPI000DCA7639|nr:hypothetical protein [Priestia endophytica]KAB2495515.1 hypothetical protein F8155_05880 [Priestia endophytica]RAS78026.1 hypothetical protein A4R27_18050 [Priestia endophytica]